MSTESAKPAKAACIKNVATFAKVKPEFKFDKPTFKPEVLRSSLGVASPKLQALVDKIHALDKTDIREHGRLFKHVVYVDYKGVYAKVVTAALLSYGFNIVHNNRFEIAEGPGKHNMACLCSTSLYDKTVPVKFRKDLVALFNRRPDNIHGKYLRFIVLDSGFREGIDCFDVKYMHIVQPLATQADTTQAIGRATRFCGQKGLTFHPQKGWPLIVFTYDTVVPADLQDRFGDIETMFGLYMQQSGIDIRKVTFAKELDMKVIEGAVDQLLTKALHEFSINNITEDTEAINLFEGGTPQLHRPRILTPLTPLKTKNHTDMRKYVSERFRKYTWPAGKLENLCGTVTGAGRPDIVEFTPTQDFVRHYFQPYSAYKGMMLYHGVGLGKTCCAIATATSSWEQEGYTILWVTRHTLKADIWKNMFQQVCSVVIQDKLKKCMVDYLDADDAINQPLKYLSKNWMAPISFKQFSNMCKGKNDVYKMLVERNGAADPLSRTLIILDEAHKLYAKDVVGAEKPDAEAIHTAIHESYKLSGRSSVRMLLMTATPYTTDPMDMISLLNLIKPPEQQFPVDFEEFSKVYLDETGKFTSKGSKRFLDDIAGYISYVNRERDARQFAYPRHHRVIVGMSRSDTLLQKQRLNQLTAQSAKSSEAIEEATSELNKIKAAIKDRKDSCKKLPKSERDACNADIKALQIAGDNQKELIAEYTSLHRETKSAITLEKKVMKKKGTEDLSQEFALFEKCL